VRLSASPKLYPGFDPALTDYVVRCDPERPVVLSIRADGEKVAVGDRAARAGEFEVRLRRRTGEGFTVRRAGATHHVRCLPRDFPVWAAERHAEPEAQWYVVTPVRREEPRGYVAVFDSNGVPVWWRGRSRYRPWDAKLLPNGNLAWTRYLGDPFGAQKQVAYEERRLDGRLVRLIRTVGTPTDTHDLTRLANGNSYVLSYRRRDVPVDLTEYGGGPRARVLDAEIQEITPKGRVAWSWNSKDHIPLSDTGDRWWPRIRTRYGWDPVHANSVEPDGDGVILSARHADAIYRIDKKTGAIDWKLGGSRRAVSLTVPGHVGDELLFAGQHDARLYGDGTLTLFDNGSRTTRPPRAVRYRIDPVTRTATPLETVVYPAATYSGAVGSARKLPGGNWAVYWGGTRFYTEQTPDGAAALTLTFPARGGYRHVPVLPGRVSARELRRGMNRMAAAKRRRG
jgi:hypothetical protein